MSPKTSLLAMLMSLSLHASESSTTEFIGKVTNIYMGKSNTIKVGVKLEEGVYLECEDQTWPMSFDLGQSYSGHWLDFLMLANRTDSKVRIGYVADSESSCVIEYLAVMEVDGGSGTDADPIGGETGQLTKTGEYDNIGLISTNGLTAASYTSSGHYGNDVAASAFDGHIWNEKINEDASEPVGRGLWMVKKTEDTNRYWLQIDFGKQVKVSGLRLLINQKSVELGRGPRNVKVQVSVDGLNFADHESFQMLRDTDQFANFTKTVQAQQFRLKIENNYGDQYIEIDELELFVE